LLGITRRTFSVATQFMVAEFILRMHAAVSAFSVATQFRVRTVKSSERQRCMLLVTRFNPSNIVNPKSILECKIMFETEHRLHNALVAKGGGCWGGKSTAPNTNQESITGFQFKLSHRKP
jgi:hypothetical protein